tara:strand:- start:3341 stop:5347 length:2007 start_codon:yes stop_codon:yes gene_type:complete
MNEATNQKLVLCIENVLFRSYLEKHFQESLSENAIFIDKDAIANSIAENQNVVLILQSETEEFRLVEIASRLKRVFGSEVKIIFLSLDYKIGEEVSTIVDRFLQFPIEADTLITCVSEIAAPEKKVLLIDDSKLVHKTIVDELITSGFDVHQAFDGLEGFEKAVEIKPSVVICDIEMPRMNGFEACSKIRNHPDLGNTYIIMSSTLGSAADQKKGFEVGVDEYITKPVIIGELIDRVQKVFNSASSGRESILILEQNLNLAKTISKSLSQQGFHTRITDSIRSSLRSLKRMNSDLILSEIEPSDGTIIDLLNSIENFDNSPDLLVMTSRDSQADARMVLNAGAVGVLSKPFNTDALLAVTERSLADRRSKKEQEQLGRYVSKASSQMAIEKAILGDGDGEARADKKTASIFFSDIAGFTERCERYTAREIVEQVNFLYDTMTKVILKNNGDIDKFIGDACMAFWLDSSNGSSNEHLLNTIIEMNQELEKMNADHPLLAEDPIIVRMGANSGEVILCDLGAADARVDLTVIGDTVNAAARLESAVKQYGVNNLVSEHSLKGVENKFCSRIIDEVRVKGKKESLKCFEIFCLNGEEKENVKYLKENFEAGFEQYQLGKFLEAKLLFKKAEEYEVVSSECLTASKLYIERCDYLIENNVDDWAGIWSLSEK